MNIKLFYKFFFLFLLLNNKVYSMEYMDVERQTLMVPKHILLSAYESEGKKFEYKGRRYIIQKTSLIHGEIGDNFKNNNKEESVILESIDGGWEYYKPEFELETCINEAGITHERFKEREFIGCVSLSVKEVTPKKLS